MAIATSNGVKSPYRAGGALPCHLGQVELQVERALTRLQAIPGPLEKYTYLANLRDRNEQVFYSLVGSNLKETTPLIYTPVIGLACQRWSEILPPPATSLEAGGEVIKALYLSLTDLPRIPEIIADLKTRVPKEEMEICVVTDGSRVLGLGDLGVGGMGISQGKLSLYVAAGGVNPKATLPIVVDLGTDNEELLANPLYVGLRQRRVSDAESEAFMDVFLKAMHDTFPKMIIQFEDFHTTLAFPLLAKNREIYPCFNDDIQGTGAVVLAGVIRAFKLNGIPLEKQRILFFGAGSSGVGVAETIVKHFELNGIPQQQAKEMFYLVDSRGLVADNRGDELPAHKRYLSRSEADAPKLKTLEEVVDFVKPTALLGLSTVGGAFTPSILDKMTQFNERPIIFALSNPFTQAECTFQAAVDATNGTVLFGAGSPFEDVEYKGMTMICGQANNFFVFPGIGLGAILAGATRIPEEMIHAAANALANSLTDDELARDLLYPNVERIREVSIFLAKAVIRSAQKLGVDTATELRSIKDTELDAFIRRRLYHPLLDKTN